MGSFEEKLTRRIHTAFLYVCKYLNQRVRIIDEWNRKSFNGVSKKKKGKNTHTKGLSFITQFKIEFSLLFTGCRKILGKMADNGF